MDRQQAIVMLKDLVDKDLVDPSFVAVGLRIPNHYQIQIKCNYNKKEIEAYAKKCGLTIKEDKEQRYLVIFKP